jgi:hypothetical protein
VSDLRNEIATVNSIVAKQTIQIAEQITVLNEKVNEQSNNMQLLLQQVLEQGRQIRELLVTRGQEQSADVDEDDGRDVKRRRTRR